MNVFTVHQVSSAYTNTFPEKTLPSFRNYFNEEINLEDDWRVAVTENNYPSKINLINTNHTIKFSAQDYKIYQTSKPEGAISKPYEGHKALINAGKYVKIWSR